MGVRTDERIDARGMIRRSPGEYLIIRPVREPAAAWEFPGGPLEGNESPEAALRRWCRALLGTELEIMLGQPPLAYGQGDQRVIYRYYLCGIRGPEPRPAPGYELRWVLAGQLRDYVFAPPMQQVAEWIAQEPPGAVG